MPTTLTDTHAHLSGCDNDALATLVGEATAAGVEMIINTATSLDTARKVLAQCNSYPNSMKAAVGVSPFDTADISGDWAKELRYLLDAPAVVAIGEIGLDCTNPAYPPIDIQMPIFLKQLEVAKDAGLPAVIHSRGMEKKTAEICRDSGVKKAIFHCFTGDREAAEYIAGCGYYVSISGIITYKKSHLRDIIRYIPPDKLLIETDTPYLSPTPHRGKPNQPAFLIHTARETAKILELDEGEFFGILGENVDRAINIKRYSFFRY